MKQLLILLTLALSVQCARPTEDRSSQDAAETEKPISRHADWIKDANIYEVNLRQYTPEGTLSAFEPHLERLASMGVEILWFMPLQPIGELNRKGEIGSYYSIRDYDALDPYYGSEEDFQRVVDKAHELGMKVVLDWVANHSSWDNKWVESNPEFYTRDEEGNMVVPADNDGNVTDWTDVADLNYDETGLHDAMISSMQEWVDRFGIDGFRCDVAGFVPNTFWSKVADHWKTTYPDRQIFMLAEWEDPAHMAYFNMNYGWEFHHITNMIAKGEMNVGHISDYWEKLDTTYSRDDIRMYFTTNHDENSWNGTVFERYGDLHETMFAMCMVFDRGMPLIYSGQENGMSHRLSFFGKDSIDWTPQMEFQDFYREMLQMKKDNPALWNGNYGGDFSIPYSDGESNLIAFKRKHSEQEVIGIFNLSDSDHPIDLDQLGFEAAEYHLHRNDGDMFVQMEYPTPSGSWDVKAGSFLIFVSRS
jgi:glycosidase